MHTIEHTRFRICPWRCITELEHFVIGLCLSHFVNTLALVSCFLCNGNVSPQEWQSQLSVEVSFFPSTSSLLLNKDHQLLFRQRVNGFPHITYIREREVNPLAKTRAPTPSLYTVYQTPQKAEALRKSPPERLWNDIRSRGLGWGIGLWEVNLCRHPPVCLRIPPCEAYSTGQANWEFPEHHALMEAWWRRMFYSSFPKKTQQGCGCAPLAIGNWNSDRSEWK